MESIKVLIVDDNPTFIGIMRRFLSRFTDIEVVAEATSAKDALALAQKTAPEIALVDVAMPEINGLTLTRMLREKYPGLAVILVTLIDTAQYRSASGGRRGGIRSQAHHQHRPGTPHPSLRAGGT